MIQGTPTTGLIDTIALNFEMLRFVPLTDYAISIQNTENDVEPDITI